MTKAIMTSKELKALNKPISKRKLQNMNKICHDIYAKQLEEMLKIMFPDMTISSIKNTVRRYFKYKQKEYFGSKKGE